MDFLQHQGIRVQVIPGNMFPLTLLHMIVATESLNSCDLIT